MCQAYEGEKRASVKGELAQIRKLWDAHVSGACLLSERDIRELAARKLMLEEA